MAPYLLLGFFAAACLRIFLDDSFVRRHLGQRGWWQTVKAALFGVPLPLCSCGVIPVAASLHRQGGSAGAVASFTASTPQTGVDSVFATAALLNWPFALVRVVVAFVNGVLAGTLVDRFGGARPAADPDPANENASTASCCFSGGAPAEAAAAESVACCSGKNEEPEFSKDACCGTPALEAKTAEPCCCSEPPPRTEPTPSCCCGGEATAENDPPHHGTSCCGSGPEANPKHVSPFAARVRDGMRFGLLTLPADIGKALLIGLFLAALLGAFLPSDLTESTWTHGVLAYLATTLVAIPLYVCSTGSIPMAYALIHAGFSPGAALVFLIAGPATNTATVSALWKMIGGRAVLIYLGTLVFVAWVSGFLLDQFEGTLDFRDGHAHEVATAWWKTTSAIALYTLLTAAFWQPWKRVKASD